MSDDEGVGKKMGEELETARLSAKALEELEERLVNKILSRVSSEDPGEGSSKQTEKGNTYMVALYQAVGISGKVE